MPPTGKLKSVFAVPNAPGTRYEGVILFNQIVAAIGFGIVTASVIGIAVLGFDLTFAVSNVINLGFVAFMLIGQFITYVARDVPLHPWSSILAGCLVAGVASSLLHTGIIRPFQRRKAPGFTLVVITLAVYALVSSVFSMIFGSSEYYFPVSLAETRGIHIGAFIVTQPQLGVIATAFAVVLVTDLVLRWTGIGRTVRAIADDRELAISAGVRSSLVTTSIWFVSGALGGLAGVCLAYTQVNFSTTSAQPYFVFIVAAAFVGGAGEMYGAAIGALIIGISIELLSLMIPPDLSPVVAFLILIVVVLARPEGIAGKGRVRLAE